MDENAKLMIQLASMMMKQSQHSQQQSQSALQLPTLPQQTTNLPNDPEKLIALARQLSNGTPESLPMTSSVLTPLILPKPAETSQPSTDQLIMAELAKQLVMNVSTSSSSGLVPAIFPPTKKHASDKPATIAQIMQLQTLQNGLANTQRAPTATFQPNKSIKQEAGMANGTSSSPDDGSSQMKHGGGPIRVRTASGRILRPGIDNFNRFGHVANPGIVMHAMEMLRQRNKKKRGPKEKETFAVFMYCLPDKNSKLPKFSSLDPVERCLVDQHQQDGYGYPAQDYINGIPRKTSLCLSFSAEKFHNFMVAIYPKLEGRMYDMYRIDKTRRLIRIDVKSPRELKDMKYQGSVIIIPYDSLADRPAPVIHRNFDDCFSTPSSNNLTMIQNLSIPLTSLPGLVSDSEVSEVTEDEFSAEQLPVFPGHLLELSPKEKAKTVTKTPEEDAAESMDADEIVVVNGGENGHTHSDINPFDEIQILEKVSELRTHLKGEKRVHIKPENMFLDLVDRYRSDSTLEQHKLSVCFQVHQFADDTTESHDDDVDTGSILVMFWEEAFRRHFTGSKDQIPVIDPTVPDDLFVILGRVLVHGLVLSNYLPIKFSPACLSHLLAGRCSDRLLLTSLYRLMSESEKEVLESAMDEVRMEAETFSPQIDHGVRVILGSYGCRKIPGPEELDSSMAAIAKCYLIRQIHWPLLKLEQGIKGASPVLFEDTKEEDILALYQALVPSVTSIIERLTYIFSSDPDLNETEKKVKVYFEQYMYKLSKAALQRLIYQWCGYDCLCLADLYVKFAGEAGGDNQIFTPKQAMICLPSVCTSLDELRELMESQSPTVGLLDS